jgi:hypothetical protein
MILHVNSDNFWAKVDVKTADGCWPWLGGKQNKGYGMFWVGHKNYLAHRVSYHLHTGKILFGSLMHTCDNPDCVNPNHLREGSQIENVSDMFRKNRQVDQKGEKNPRAILTTDQVRKIRDLKKEGKTNVELGNMFGVHFGTISNICIRKIWKHI